VKASWGKFDQAAFDENIKQWEWSWVVSRKDYPVKPAGSPTKIASQLYQKYVNRIIPLTKVMAPIKYDY
jgi:alpha-N-acetylglucosaminidase